MKCVNCANCKRLSAQTSGVWYLQPRDIFWCNSFGSIVAPINLVEYPHWLMGMVLYPPRFDRLIEERKCEKFKKARAITGWRKRVLGAEAYVMSPDHPLIKKEKETDTLQDARREFR